MSSRVTRPNTCSSGSGRRYSAGPDRRSGQLFDLGGDSILSMQVVSRARQAGLRMTSKDLFLHQTIGELAPEVLGARVDQARAEPVTGSVPLTPIQHWFFQTHTANPHHFNQSSWWS